MLQLRGAKEKEKENLLWYRFAANLLLDQQVSQVLRNHGSSTKIFTFYRRNKDGKKDAILRNLSDQHTVKNIVIICRILFLSITLWSYPANHLKKKAENKG